MRAAFHQHRLESLNAQTVQRRRTVQQHRVLLDDFFQNVPDLGTALFHHTLGVLAMVRLLQASPDASITKGLNSSSAISFGRPH